MKFAHAEVLKFLPLLAPQDITSTATGSSYIDIQTLTGLIEFEINFGTITSTDTTGVCTITIEGSTSGASTDTNTEIAFQYMKSSAINTDTMGAITAASATGIEVGPTEDNVSVLCYLDPAVLTAAVAGERWARVYLEPTTDWTATLVNVVARATPNYSQVSQESAT